MPKQETYFEKQIGDRRIVVMKSYDAAFAHEAFEQVDLEALRFLSRSLALSQDPLHDDENYADALWEEVQDGAREEWNTFSYFIVSEETAGTSLPIYVSSDWPSAEAFATQYALNRESA